MLQRKKNRLEFYDYSNAGWYFITICTKDRQNILSTIVGADLPGGPKVELTEFGVVAERQIQRMNEIYSRCKIEQYVIMPNHIHLLMRILPEDGGSSGRPTPTSVSDYVGTFKRFCNRRYGKNIFQRSFYDHIIRDEADYLKIWNYIQTNPAKWAEDRFYSK